MAIVLYPGSFDPITKGHMSIIKQATAPKLFDKVVVAILHNPNKKACFFTIEEKLEMIKELYKNNPKVEVITSIKAAVDVAKEYNCQAIVRGIRGLSDLDEEKQLASFNRDLSRGKINTLCFFAEDRYQNYSSTAVREVYSLGKNYSKYVDPFIAQKMRDRRRNI